MSQQQPSNCKYMYFINLTPTVIWWIAHQLCCWPPMKLGAHQQYITWIILTVRFVVLRCGLIVDSIYSKISGNNTITRSIWVSGLEESMNPDNKDLRVDTRHFRIGSMYNRCQPEDLCNLGRTAITSRAESCAFSMGYTLLRKTLGTYTCNLTHLSLDKWPPFHRRYLQMHFRE